MENLMKCLFLLLLSLGFSTIYSQELGFDRSFTLGVGLSHSNLNPSNTIIETEKDILIIKDIENYGPRTGWSFNSGLYQRIDRHWGIYGELAIQYSRRKGTLDELLTHTMTITQKNGILRYNNLHAQILLAPRFQFGQFNRFYISIGPYFDQNLWNFSSFQYSETFFANPEPILVDGELIFDSLEEPVVEINDDPAAIKPFDFGGQIMVGTILSLPGKNSLALELRYARGAFRLAETHGVRQNRFVLFVGYSINTYSRNTSYQKYIPFLD